MRTARGEGLAAYYNEFDPGAAAWLRELIKQGSIADGEVDERSILDVRPDDVRGFTQCHWFAGIGGWSYALRLSGWPDDLAVWTGSPPCQPFSNAGKQKGKDDERHLAPHFAELIAACRPPALFGEQVASAAVFGKAATRSRVSVEGASPLEWAWLDDLFERLEAARYACGASDVPAAGIGAPHIRQRTFFGAVRLADASGSASKWDAGSIPRAKAPQHGAWFAVNGFVPVGHQHGGANGRLADANSCGQPGSRLMGRSGNPEAREDRQVSRVVNDGWGRRLADTSISGWGEERQVGGRLCAGDGAQGWTAGLDAGRELGGLDDTSSARHNRSLGGAESNSRDETRVRLSGSGCGNGGLAEPDCGQRDRIADGEGRLCDGPTTGWQQGNSEFECGCTSSRSYAPDSPWGVADWLYCRDGKWRPVESSVLGLADGLPSGLVHSGAFVSASSPLSKRQPGAERQSPNARRVMRLRGYGNAIVPRAAAEFICAFSSAIEDLSAPEPLADFDPLADL